MPSQQVGKVMTERIPPAQKPVGRVWASGDAQLMLLLSPLAGMQRWQTLFCHRGELATMPPRAGGGGGGGGGAGGRGGGARGGGAGGGGGGGGAGGGGRAAAAAAGGRPRGERC